MIYAHIGGIPVEESLLGIAPAACALAVLVRLKLRQLTGWRRREH